MTTTSLSFASVFSADIEKLSTFYRELLGLDEVLELRSGTSYRRHHPGFQCPDCLFDAQSRCPAP